MNNLLCGVGREYLVLLPQGRDLRSNRILSTPQRTYPPDPDMSGGIEFFELPCLPATAGGGGVRFFYPGLADYSLRRTPILTATCWSYTFLKSIISMVSGTTFSILFFSSSQFFNINSAITEPVWNL